MPVQRRTAMGLIGVAGWLGRAVLPNTSIQLSNHHSKHEGRYPLASPNPLAQKTRRLSRLPLHVHALGRRARRTRASKYTALWPTDRSIDRSIQGRPIPHCTWLGGILRGFTEIGLLGRRRYDTSRGASSSGAGRRPTRGRCIAGTPCTRRAGPTTANGPLEVRYVDDWWDARSPVMVWMGEWMDAAVPGDWPL